MTNVIMTQLTPKELTALISEGVKTHIENLLIQHSGQPAIGKEFLSRKETAEFFGVSLVCIHDWIKKGIITPYKTGNRTYFNRAELVQQLFNSNKKVA